MASCAWRLVPTNRISLAFGGQVGDELGRFLEHLQRLLQVDDVNPVALAEDVFLHLRIPALGLMPEVNASFEQLFHRDVCHATSSLVCILRDACGRALGICIPVTRPVGAGAGRIWSRMINRHSHLPEPDDAKT